AKLRAGDDDLHKEDDEEQEDDTKSTTSSSKTDAMSEASTRPSSAGGVSDVESLLFDAMRKRTTADLHQLAGRSGMLRWGCLAEAPSSAEIRKISQSDSAENSSTEEQMTGKWASNLLHHQEGREGDRERRARHRSSRSGPPGPFSLRPVTNVVVADPRSHTPDSFYAALISPVEQFFAYLLRAASTKTKKFAGA
ncbi:unnamed protein product, partial [Amoebophrya sp. A25]